MRYHTSIAYVEPEEAHTNETSHQSPASDERQVVDEGRRKLLKALAATGGAVTATSLLPDKWAKPVVDVGVLPAHAQVSPTLTVGVSYDLASGINNCNNGAGSSYNLVITYQDPGGNVSDTSNLQVISTFNPSGAAGFTYNGPLAGWPGARSGNANAGTISAGLCTAFNTATSNTISATLTNDIGLSASASDTENRPIGANQAGDSPSQSVL